MAFTCALNKMVPSLNCIRHDVHKYIDHKQKNRKKKQDGWDGWDDETIDHGPAQTEEENGPTVSECKCNIQAPTGYIIHLLHSVIGTSDMFQPKTTTSTRDRKNVRRRAKPGSPKNAFIRNSKIITKVK